jgi:hypothetical protein
LLSHVLVFSTALSRFGKSHLLVPEADDVLTLVNLLSHVELLLHEVGVFVVESFILNVSFSKESHSLVIRLDDLLGEAVGVVDFLLDSVDMASLVELGVSLTEFSVLTLRNIFGESLEFSLSSLNGGVLLVGEPVFMELPVSAVHLVDFVVGVVLVVAAVLDSR